MLWANAHRRYLSARGEEGWDSASAEGRSEIIGVERGGPADGALARGDELAAINGGGGLGESEIVNERMRRVAPGASYAVLVRRGGQLREVTLRTRPAPLSTLINGYVLKILTPLSFLLTGVVVFLLRPFDKEAVLLALLLAVFPALPNGFFAGYAGLPAALAWLLWAARVAAHALFAVVFMHFFLIFPESKGFASPILRRLPRLERGLYLLLIFSVPFGVMIVMAQGQGLGRVGAGWRRAGELVFPAGAVLGLGSFVGGLVSLVVNYRMSGEASRRKMRVVVLASLAAFVPLLCMLLLEVFDLVGAVRPLGRWLDYSLYFLLPLVPLSFAYAIVRHKVIPVSLIIRRGVRYLFVSRGSVVLELLTVGVVMFFLMDWLFSRTTATGRTVGVVSGVVAILVWVAARALHVRVVAPAIDRRFFRRSYNAQQILSELGRTLRALPRVEETCALVSARVQEALQTENVTVFLREEASGDFRAECSARFLEAERQAVVGRQELRLARDSFVVARLAESEQPLDVDFEDPQGWARSLLSEGGGAGESRRREGETLRAAGSALLLPVATKDRLVGVISLGPRLGDLPFSGEDTQMLSTVAVQVAFALEN
ncbi:MAG: GAF domain-containing protein, partial [Acidobacteria bacterium]|nr:GAF domain-containing protein [Acidobacteriota bacterium]